MTSKKSQTILERKERRTRETSPVSKVVDTDSLINDIPSTTHSTNKELLVVSEDNVDSYGNCTFSVIVPSLWNNLLDQIRTVACLSSLKSKVKTFHLVIPFSFQTPQICS